MATTATRIEKRRLRRGGGLESMVDVVGAVGLMLGAFTAIGILLWFHSSVGVLAAIGTAWGAFVQWLLFSCLAEHLRLQKKLAGVRFQGQISGPQEEVVWACSQCDHMLHSETRCEVCGATIVADDEGLN